MLLDNDFIQILFIDFSIYFSVVLCLFMLCYKWKVLFRKGKCVSTFSFQWCTLLIIILRQNSLPENPHYSIDIYQVVNDILPPLLQKEKETTGNRCVAKSVLKIENSKHRQLMGSFLQSNCDTHLSLRHNVKKSLRLKFKIMSITCRFHVFDVVLTLQFS